MASTHAHPGGDKDQSILVAYDGSGSTGNVRQYHEVVRNVVASADARAAALGSAVTLLLWDNTARVTPREEFAHINALMLGGGGTEPEAIAQWVGARKFHGHLIIITDGQVCSSSVDRVETAMADAARRAPGGVYKFASVEVHLVQTTSSPPNMSVPCPFTRASPHTVFKYGRSQSEPQRVACVTTEDFAAAHAVRTIDTEAAFAAHFAAIERAVVAATMGAPGNPAMRDALLAMKKRVVSSAAVASGAGGPAHALEWALDARDGSAALAAARALTTAYYGEDTADEGPDDETFSARVSRLVSMCEGALRQTFDLSGLSAAIRSDRMRRAAVTRAAPAAALEVLHEGGADEGAQEGAQEGAEGAKAGARFECPVLFDDDASAQDVLLLLADDAPPVLEGEELGVVNACLDCPLNALDYPQVVRKLRDKLDYAISLKAWKELEEHDSTGGHEPLRSPMTRRPVVSGLCLGADEAHARATTWALDRAITGGKRAGNADLWFAVVWRLLEDDAPAWIDAAVVGKARAHMSWRLAHHTSFLSLTGLSELPTTRVSLRAAVWYVLAASALNPGPKREALRAHMFHATPLLALVELAGLAETLPAGTNDHLRRLRALACALAWTKKEGQRDALAQAVRALTQAAECIELDRVLPAVRETSLALKTSRVLWIFTDGAASLEQVALVRQSLPPPLAACTASELVEIAARADPQCALGDISLPFDLVLRAPPAPVSEWAGVYTAATLEASRQAPPIQIHLATCRPRYYVASGRVRTWVDAVHDVFGVEPAQLVSLHNVFGLFVDRFGAYPSFDDFLTFVAMRVLSPDVDASRRHATLPAHIRELAHDVWASTLAARTAIPDAAEFARRWNASREIVVRQRIEQDAEARAA